MNIVIFGIGNFYKENKHHIASRDSIIAYLDNDSSMQGQKIEGITVYNPSQIHNLTFDIIVLMSIYAAEMKRQLIDIGVPEDKIWIWSRYVSEYSRGMLKLFCYHDCNHNSKKKILVLSTHLSYNGGTIAAVNAVKALQLQGYQVFLAAPSGDEQFIDEVSRQKVNIILCPSIYYLGKEEAYWINQFDIVIVNVFQMISCACEISQFKPVLWWIHEPSMSYCTIYERTREEFSQYDNLSAMKYVNVAAVSKIAKCNFETYYPEKVNHVLPYGIPDEHVLTMDEGVSNKFVFAIIGAIEERKAQKIFLQAILKFAPQEIDRIEFLLIGADSKEKIYCRDVKELSKKIPQIRIVGQLTREEMRDIYHKIDVIVCASMEETMSLTITEGMMHGKLCITTDATGMAEYITHKINGFVCKAGDVESLYENMKWIIDHSDELYDIRNNARKTYEKYFTLKSFGERLERLICETVGEFADNTH